MGPVPWPACTAWKRNSKESLVKCPLPPPRLLHGKPSGPGRCDSVDGNYGRPRQSGLTLADDRDARYRRLCSRSALETRIRPKKHARTTRAGRCLLCGNCEIVGAAIGKQGLTYSLVPAAQLKPVLIQMGMSPNMADLLLEMADALNSGFMRALEPRSAANATPTTVETFVTEVFSPAYRGKA